MPIRPRILIVDLDEAAELAHTFDAVITAGPTAQEVAEHFSHPDHLVVEFRDVVHRDAGGPTRDAVRAIVDFAATRAKGYGFQIELAYRVAKAGGKIVEIPISFTDRVRGHSKMSMAVMAEEMPLVSAWGIRDRFSRSSSPT